MSDSTEIPPAPEFYQSQPALTILLEDRIRLRQLEEAHQKLWEALQPFIGACAVVNLYEPADDACLADALPAGWPSVGQLRELVKAAKELPSPLDPNTASEKDAVIQERAEEVPEQVKPAEAAERKCRFYGKNGMFGQLVEQGGNECGLIVSSYSPCRMLMAGRRVDETCCPLVKQVAALAARFPAVDLSDAELAAKLVIHSGRLYGIGESAS